MDVNPTTGQPLREYETIVVGAAPGYRQTVVDTRPGATLPRWISRIDVPIDFGATVTTFFDNGAAQSVPEIESHVSRDYTRLAVVGAVLALLLLVNRYAESR